MMDTGRESKDKTVVLKFGGAAVASPQHFHHLAEIILQRSQRYSRVVVVVSAMGDTTDYLIGLAQQVNSSPPSRELDMLVSVGERISIALLAMAVASRGKEAISFTGSQSGIITSPRHAEARIIDIRPHRLLPHLEVGRIVIVAGFQGVSLQGEITTLGRGGSDTTAVALGVALEADRVEFFKDVPGIFMRDPKIDPEAPFLPALTYDEMLRMLSETNSGVLHTRSVRLAEKNDLPLYVMSYEECDQPAQKMTRIGNETRLGPSRKRLYEGGDET